MNTFYKGSTQKYIFNTGEIVTKKKKDAEDEKHIYEMYYDFKDSIKNIKNYRVLAINRGEKEGILNITLEYNKEYINTISNKRAISLANHVFLFSTRTNV